MSQSKTLSTLLLCACCLALSSGCVDVVQQSAVNAAGSVIEALFVDLFEGLGAGLGGPP